jgi:hypothetical protein
MLLMAAVTALSGVVAAPPPAGAVDTTKTFIQYVVSPHPDDVFEAWSLVQDAKANYPVFVTLTKGESTAYCKGAYATPINVAYYGSFDRSTAQGCKGARMASLDNWLDDQSDTDDYLNDYVRGGDPAKGATMQLVTDVAAAGAAPDSGAPTKTGINSCAPAWSASQPCAGTNPNAGAPVADNLNDPDGATLARGVTWYVGATSARVEFDLGDGNLTDDEAVWAVDYVRSKRGVPGFLPDIPEYGVIAAAYSNVGQEYSACTEYSHHDHRAVQEAVYDTDLIPDDGAAHPQWGVTCGSQTTSTGVDPEALRANGGRSNAITTARYAANMGSASASFQVRFGWLRAGALWPANTDPVGGVIFSRWNYFWRRY